MDDGLGNMVDEFDKLVVDEANERNNQQRWDAAKGRYAKAKEVRGNVAAKCRGVSEEANRLWMLLFSLTKYSAIFAEVKGYFGNPLNAPYCNWRYFMYLRTFELNWMQ